MLTKYVLLSKEYMAEPLMVFDSEEDAKQMQEAIKGGSILELPYIEGSKQMCDRVRLAIQDHGGRSVAMMEKESRRHKESASDGESA